MTVQEHRRAKWRLRREVRLLISDMASRICYRIDTARLEQLRARAYRGAGPDADAYARYAARYWRVWG